MKGTEKPRNPSKPTAFFTFPSLFSLYLLDICVKLNSLKNKQETRMKIYVECIKKDCISACDVEYQPAIRDILPNAKLQPIVCFPVQNVQKMDKRRFTAFLVKFCTESVFSIFF